MNVFDHPSAAERYARGRPYFHPLVAERIARVCSSVERALDVGCGTGRSTLALTEIGQHTVGADSSLAMLERAERHPRVSFVASRAEALPFAPRAFDLVMAGLAFHWFNRQAFLSEAHRVLKSGGWLAIFNDHFAGQMRGNEDYARWNRDHYARRYPAPARDRTPFTDDDARGRGFVARSREQFTHVVSFTPEQLVGYLLTHSNVIAAAEGGAGDIHSIEAWLSASVRPLFRSEVAEFPFRCVLDLFQKRCAN